MRKYTVILMYPDDGNPLQSYMAWVEAKDPAGAVEAAQLEGEKDNCGLVHADEFDPFFVCRGHVKDLNPTIKEK